MAYAYLLRLVAVLLSCKRSKLKRSQQGDVRRFSSFDDTLTTDADNTKVGADAPVFCNARQLSGNCPKEKTVYKHGAFKIKQVMYRPWFKPYRHNTLHIEKTNGDAPLPPPPPVLPKAKLATPKHNKAQAQDSVIRRGHRDQEEDAVHRQSP